MRKIQIAISSSVYYIDMKFGWSRMVVKLFQDGGRPPFWKSLYRHISAKNHPISMKFCTQQQILNWMNVTWSKMKKLHWTDSKFDRTYFLCTNKLTFLLINYRTVVYADRQCFVLSLSVGLQQLVKFLLISPTQCLGRELRIYICLM